MATNKQFRINSFTIANFNNVIYDLMSVADDKLSFTEIAHLLNNKESIQANELLTDDEKSELLKEITDIQVDYIDSILIKKFGFCKESKQTTPTFYFNTTDSILYTINIANNEFELQLNTATLETSLTYKKAKIINSSKTVNIQLELDLVELIKQQNLLDAHCFIFDSLNAAISLSPLGTATLLRKL